MAHWLPIESAPKDGTRVDIWCASDDRVDQWRETDCVWTEIRQVFLNTRGMWDCATHWMALPDPPLSEAVSLAQEERQTKTKTL